MDCAPPTSRRPRKPLQLDLFRSGEQLRERDRRAAERVAAEERQRDSAHLAATRARNSDPVSSHQAAVRSGEFSNSHEHRILVALEVAREPLTGHEIAQLDERRNLAITGMTNVQVLRRTREMATKQKLVDRGQVFCRVCNCRETAWGLPGQPSQRKDA